MNNITVQLYGIRTVRDAKLVISLGVNHIGVSYGKIKRTPGQLTCEQAKEIFDSVAGEVVRVGLTVASDLDEISENLAFVQPDVLHLSGDIEDIPPQDVKELKKRFPGLKIMQALPVWQGIPLSEQKVLEYIRDYEPYTDYFLIDTKGQGTTDIGATGLVHDRSIDKAIVESTKVPCIIAGGLDADNVAEAIRICHPYGVDSYTFTNYEKPFPEEGNKDPEKVKAFVEAARNVEL